MARNITEAIDALTKAVQENGGSGALPEITSEDAGKVLMVGEDGELELVDLSSKLLPTVTSEDAGGTLLVSSEGVWEVGTAES